MSHKQRGFALLSVMIITSLMAIAVISHLRAIQEHQKLFMHDGE